MGNIIRKISIAAIVTLFSFWAISDGIYPSLDTTLNDFDPTIAVGRYILEVSSNQVSGVTLTNNVLTVGDTTITIAEYEHTVGTNTYRVAYMDDIPTNEVVPSDSTPLMDTSLGSSGVSNEYARADHTHPSDTSRLSTDGGTVNGANGITFQAPQSSGGYSCQIATGTGGDIFLKFYNATNALISRYRVSPRELGQEYEGSFALVGDVQSLIASTPFTRKWLVYQNESQIDTLLPSANGTGYMIWDNTGNNTLFWDGDRWNFLNIPNHVHYYHQADIGATELDFGNGLVCRSEADYYPSQAMAEIKRGLKGICDEWSASTWYRQLALVWHEGTLYRCTAEHQSGSTWNATEASYWTKPTTISDALHQIFTGAIPFDGGVTINTGGPNASLTIIGSGSYNLRINDTYLCLMDSNTSQELYYAALPLASGTIALTKDLPYDLNPEQKQNRSVRLITITNATTTLDVMPTLQSGKVTDFIIDIQNSYATNSVPVEAVIEFADLGSTWNAVVASGETLGNITSLAAGEMARFYITQTAFTIDNKPVFMISKQVVEAVPYSGALYVLETDGSVSTEGELNSDGTLTVEGELNSDGTLTVEAQ